MCKVQNGFVNGSLTSELLCLAMCFKSWLSLASGVFPGSSWETLFGSSVLEAVTVC